jgi:NADH:ubiquinone oxidoreductase subunit 2 (subunit N)
LRVIILMYMREPRKNEDLPAIRIPAGVGLSLAISLILTIYLGVWPGQVLDYAVKSAQQMLR